MTEETFLLLEDGAFFKGRSFGARIDSLGEIVFHTAMSGYQEALSDPSYRRQMLTMTYPHIGNYGIHDEDMESEKVQAAGLIVRSYCAKPSHFHSKMSLGRWLSQADVPGIEGLDTRKLVRKLRQEGSMRGGIFQGLPEGERLRETLDQVKASPNMNGQNLVDEVTCSDVKVYPAQGDCLGKVSLLDFGVKENIIRLLQKSGLEVMRLPSSTSASEMIQSDADAFFLSNGPGDPASMNVELGTICTLLSEDQRPVFGICLGHQLLSRALGFETYKLKFGHRGANHPVRVEESHRVLITSQNHGFAVKESSSADGIVTHISLYDGTVEGIRAKERPYTQSLQFHPEASPGPHDARDFFETFSEAVKEFKAKKGR